MSGGSSIERDDRNRERERECMRGEHGGFPSLYPWSPDGYGRIFRSYVFGPLGFWTMAPLHYAAKFDPFFSLDCSPMPSTLAQSKERKGSNFAIWQPCPSIPYSLSCFHLAAELSRTLMKVGRRCCSVESTRKREGRVGGSIYSFSSRQHVMRPQRRTHSPSFSFRLHSLLFHYIQELNTCSGTSVCGRACI